MTPRLSPSRPGWLALGLAGLVAAALSGAAPAAGKAKGAKAQRAAAAASAASAGVAQGSYARRDDVTRFAAEAAQRQGLDADWVRATLAAARYQASVARLIMPAAVPTAKNWAAYRARFVEPRRIAAGVAFWRANAAWLARAEQRFGVPPEIVVGIVGVETIYGQQMGSFRAVDALATLAFDFPSGRSDRSAFFREELEQLFVLCRGEPRPACDPLVLKSSYAGALGMPQFMPGSVNRFAIDFDGDGRIDLHRSAADTIGSVANYLAAHGWQRELPTHFPVSVPEDATERATLLAPDIVPSFSADEFEERGAMLDAAGRAHAGLLALVELHNGEAAPSYVAGTANFYAITRYNWSSYYALAVIELGAAVRRQAGSTQE